MILKSEVLDAAAQSNVTINALARAAFTPQISTLRDKAAAPRWLQSFSTGVVRLLCVCI
jgi:hypothetical protein